MPKLEELETGKRDLEDRRKRLELPAIDREMLAAIVDNFEQVMAEGPNPKKKHLLHRLVKKVLIHSRQTIEIWYGLPNRASVRTPGYLAPHMCRSTNRQAEPEVYFRIVHATQNCHNGAPVAAYREQEVEIALGPKGAFENGNSSALMRQVPADTTVIAAPRRGASPKLQRSPRRLGWSSSFTRPSNGRHCWSPGISPLKPRSPVGRGSPGLG
jgi:hypothetical protein